MQHQYSLSDFGATRHEGTLKNGLKVVFIEKPFAPIYAKVMMRSGSIFDPLDRLGLAHFTEHIIASGSPTHSKEAFSGLMESIGGYWNAETGEDYMSVQCEVAIPEHLGNMKEYFTHALSSVHLTEESLQNEKDIIISEIERARSNPDYLAYLYLGNIFANGTHWNSATLGTVESVSSISIKDVQDFFSTYCTAENMVVVVSGGCSWADIESTFESIPLIHGQKHDTPKDPAVLAPNAPIIFEQDVPQTTIVLGFLGPEIDTRDDVLLTFALRYAHDGITSRFFKKIRNQKGLAYNISFSALTFKTLQYVGTSVGVPTHKVQETIDAVLECYKELVEEGISQKEINDKIDTMWFSAKRTKQTSHDLASTMTYSELYPAPHPLYGSYPDVYNYRRTYTAEEMLIVLKKYITLDNYYLALNGRKLSKFIQK